MKTAFGDRSRLAIGLVVAVSLAVLAVVLVASPADSSTSEPPHPVAGGSLDPATIPKYQEPLVIPPAMPRTQVVNGKGKQIDYYEIAVKQFEQYILPEGLVRGPTPSTRPRSGATPPCWIRARSPRAAPSTTRRSPIEAQQNRPVRVKWINGLVDENGQLPAAPAARRPDPALGQPARRPGRHRLARHGRRTPYTGPVPIVTHVHGAHTTEDSDGYPEAWYLPAADEHPRRLRDRRHLLRAVQAGVRGPLGPDLGARLGRVPVPERPAGGHAVVPRPLARHDPAQRLRRSGRVLPAARHRATRWPPGCRSPRRSGGTSPGTKYREIPIAIQDRSFNADGSLFYPDNRAFFEGLNVPGQSPQFPGAPELRIPFTPDTALDGKMSDISPQWNPEFFGNTMVVNGKTWPYLNVEQRRYRFRLLNGTPVPVPHPQDEQRHALHADRQRGRVPAQAGQAAGAADRAGGARRRDRRLQQGQARDADRPAATSGRTSRSAAARPARSSSRPTRAPPARSCSSASERPRRPTRARRRASSGCRRSSGCRKRASSATSV